MFEHFVITRFNLKLENHFNKDKNGNPTLTDNWLRHRFELFEKYCFPSLIAQSCKQFYWLLLLDTNTPPEYKMKIETYQNIFPNLYPLFLETGKIDYIRKTLIDTIHLLSDKKATFLITTRIDNDDAFHRNMIEEVQSYFVKNKVESFLNYNYGIQYDVKEDYAVKIRYEKNHFSSRLEMMKPNLETVIFHDHTQIDRFAKVQSVENKKKPMWIEVIHESNVSNATRLSKPYFSSRYFKNFNLDFSIDIKKSFSIWLKYSKIRTYDFLSRLFNNLGLFKEYKKLIQLFK